MNKFIFIFISILLNISFANDNYVQAEGRFWAEENDSSIFIKNQLLHAGFINVITKELTTMGLDQELFWQKYNDSFEESFKEAQEQLKAKMQIDQDSTAQKKLEYEKELRILKLNKRRNHLKLDNVIQSFAMKAESKSPTSPQSRFLKLEAKVNRVELGKLYSKLIRVNNAVKFEKLFVVLEYDLRGLTWADIGLDGESALTDELHALWKKWMLENKPENIETIEIVSKSNHEMIKDHLNLSNEYISSHASSTMKNSLLLLSNIIIRKENVDGVFDEFKLFYSGGQVLIDLGTNRPVLQMDVNVRDKSYSDLAKKDLSSAVATYIYRLPLDNYSEINKLMASMQLTKNTKKIVVSDFTNISQVIYFNNFLEEYGAKLKLKAKLASFNREKSELVVFYQGDDTILMNYLGELKAKSISSAVPFEFMDPAQPFMIKLLPRKEATPQTDEEKAQDQQSEV